MSGTVSGRASLLTPLGRGAVAVVAAEGEAAFAAVDAAFVAANGRTIREQRAERILFGHWTSGEHREEVVVIRCGETIEIHCHGGLAASERILAALAAAGCTIEPWPDRVQRLAASTILAEADMALAQATTKRTAAILLAQREGALQRAIEGVRSELAAGRTETASSLLEALLSRAALGLHLTAPWHVAIAGRPNVGKSCLINALVGYERAIVFDQPGTTRDVLTAETAIDGWPVRLADAAGIRETDDELEAEGVLRARRQLAEADLILWVVDSTAVEGDPWQAARDEWLAVVGLPFDAARTLIVANKVDLVDVSKRQRLPSSSGSLPLVGATSTVASGDRAQAVVRAQHRAGEGVERWYTLQSPLPNPPHQGEGTSEFTKVEGVTPRATSTDPLAEPGAEASFISALTGQGMPELIAAIGERLVPAVPTDEAVPFTSRQLELLKQARASIVDGQPAVALEQLSRL